MVLALGGPARAGAQSCLEDFGPVSNYGCAASDVDLTLVGVGIIQDGCTDPADDAVAIDLRIRIESTTGTTRYDLGLWIALDGGNARTGTCLRETSGPPSSVTGSSSCTDVDLTCGDGPFFNDDGDLCPDLHPVMAGPDCGQEDDPLDPGDDLTCGPVDSVPDSHVYDFPTPVQIPCTDTDGNGLADVGVCTTWGTSPNEVSDGDGTCDGSNEVQPGAVGKCGCSRPNTVIPVPDLFIGCTCTGTDCTLEYTNADLPGCTPNPGKPERFRCGTAGYVRFDLDYDEAAGTPTGVGVTDGSVNDDGSVLRWTPQGGAVTPGLIAEGQSGALDFGFLLDPNAPAGSIVMPAVTIYADDPGFVGAVPQSLSTTCTIQGAEPVPVTRPALRHGFAILLAAAALLALRRRATR